MDSEKSEGRQEGRGCRLVVIVLLLLGGIGLMAVGALFDQYARSGYVGYFAILFGISMIVAGITCLVKKPKNPSENE